MHTNGSPVQRGKVVMEMKKENDWTSVLRREGVGSSVQ